MGLDGLGLLDPTIGGEGCLPEILTDQVTAQEFLDIDIGDEVEDGAGHRPRQIMHLSRHLRYLAAITGDADLPRLRNLADPVDLVKRIDIAAGRMQQAVEHAVEMHDRHQGDDVGIGFVEGAKFRRPMSLDRKPHGRE